MFVTSIALGHLSYFLRFESLVSTHRATEASIARDVLNKHVLSYQKTSCATSVKCKVIFSIRIIQFQAALSNVLTESMTLLARIAKCEVRKYTSQSRSIQWLSFRTFFENSSRYNCNCKLHLNVFVQDIGPSSGYPTNCESSTLARKSICKLFRASTIFFLVHL